MRPAPARLRASGRALTLAAALLCAAAAAGEESTAPAPRYEVVTPASEPSPPALAPLPELDAYTVAAVRAMLPAEYTGRTARVVPLDRLYFLHSSNLIEMDGVWRARGAEPPTAIVLGRGSYGLESVRRQLDDPAVLSLEPDGSYLLKRPLYVAPTATFVVGPGQTLRMAADRGTFLYSNGTLFVVDATLVAWDPVRGGPAPREAVDRETLLLYAHQSPRPYLLASEGSRTFLAGSTIRGLGYKGTSGTFGISFSPSAGGGRLAEHVRRLPRPTGQIVGNRIVDLFFGFYSNEAEHVAIVGNLFTSNVVYGIDPHDYSRNLVVARNVTQGARFKHGIIFSRGVRDSWVVQNASIANAGSGVMMDRASTHNLVAQNLVVGNGGDGIAIFESDDNVVRGNEVRRNLRNGILVRNSVGVQVLENTLARNGRSGLEIASADISGLETRDFALDPYRQHATASVRGNVFDDNVRSAVSAVAVDALTLHGNRYLASGPLYFDGDLGALSGPLIAAELGGRTPVQVRREGASPPAALPTHASAEGAAREPQPLLLEHAGRGDPLAMLGLARHYAGGDAGRERRREAIYWYGRAIRHARLSALGELGVALVSGLAADQRERREGLVLLAMAARLGDARADVDLHLLPDLVGTGEAEVAAARQRAAERLRARRLWDDGVFAGVDVRLGPQETYDAKRRVDRLLQEARAGTAYSPPRLDPARRERYDERVDRKNARRVSLNERRREDALADARADGERRAYLDRVRRRDRGSELRARSYTEAQWQEQRTQLVRLLELVNRHRAAEDPLGLGEVMLPPRAAQD